MDYAFGGGDHLDKEKEIYLLKRRLAKPADKKQDILDKISLWKDIQAELYDVKAIKYSDMPHGTDVGKPTEEKVMLIQRLQENIEQLKEELKDLEKEMQDFDHITACLNPIQKNILSLRYIKGYTWEKIAFACNYTRKQCFNIHNAALEIIVKRNKEK